MGRNVFGKNEKPRAPIRYLLFLALLLLKLYDRCGLSTTNSIIQITFSASKQCHGEMRMCKGANRFVVRTRGCAIAFIAWLLGWLIVIFMWGGTHILWTKTGVATHYLVTQIKHDLRWMCSIGSEQNKKPNQRLHYDSFLMRL